MFIKVYVNTHLGTVICMKYPIRATNHPVPRVKPYSLGPAEISQPLPRISTVLSWYCKVLSVTFSTVQKQQHRTIAPRKWREKLTVARKPALWSGEILCPEDPRRAECRMPHCQCRWRSAAWIALFPSVMRHVCRPTFWHLPSSAFVPVRSSLLLR